MVNTLRHWFVPHHSNNHRAKALHIDAMFVYAFAFVIFNLATRVISINHPDILGYATNIHVEQLLAETNVKRQAAGLSPLSLNNQLSQAAAGKASDMFGKNYWAHVSPDGKTPWDFIVGAGYKYSVAGENLAKNFQDSSGVVTAWMNSPSHKENLLKPNYKEVGFAVVNGVLQGEETTLVVQMFGSQPGGRTVVAAEPSPALETAQSPVGNEQPVITQPPAIAQAPEITPAVEEQVVPVVIPEVASVTEVQSNAGIFPAFSSVLLSPKFDIVAVRRDVSMVFAGIFAGVLLVDMYVAMKKRTIRAVGSSLAHVLFFGVMIVSMNVVLRGSII
jgi:hypothetical protein